MADAPRTQTRSVSYSQARSLVLILGLVALGIVALIMYVRRVDPAEVSATLFFLPIFVGFLFFGIRLIIRLTGQHILACPALKHTVTSG